MRLNSITIQNFRFFYGENTFDFSADASKPITVFIGENGGGKSSIMNALVWCFFNELIPGSDRPEEIRHDACDSNDDVIVSVRFNHEDKDYEATRGFSKQLGKYFVFKIIDENGVSKRLSSGEQEIYKIIPNELRSWFFYAGESDLKKVNLSGSKEFKESLSQIQGFTLVRRLIQDLEEAEKQKKRDLDRMGVSNTSGLRAKIDQKEVVLSPIKKRIEEIEASIKEKSIRKESITNKLRELPKSKTLQLEKEGLNTKNNRAHTKIRDLKIDQIAMEGSCLPAILMYGSVQKYKASLEKDPTKNSLILEEPYGKKLFNRIMQDGRCICGTQVNPGSNEEKKLMALHEQAKPDTFNLRIAFIESAISEVEGFREQFPNKHSRLTDDIETFQKEIDENKEQIDKIDKALGQIDEVHYQGLLNEEKQLDHEIGELKKEFGRKDQVKSELETEIKKLEDEISQSANKLNLYSGIKKLLGNIQIVKKYVSEKLISDEKKSLTIISYELNDLLNRYFYANYNVRIDPNTYAVDLINPHGDNVTVQKTSTGEMEVLKYFFITTVLGLASRKTREKINYLSQPTIAPLVMDAPFTGLSTDYTERVINAFLNNLDQLVFLALPEKFPSYENIIKEKVGKAYVIVKKVQGEQGMKEMPKKFKVFGKEYSFVEYGHDVSCSKIVKI